MFRNTHIKDVNQYSRMIIDDNRQGQKSRSRMVIDGQGWSSLVKGSQRWPNMVKNVGQGWLRMNNDYSR